jgi:hypothetical protein
MKATEPPITPANTVPNRAKRPILAATERVGFSSGAGMPEVASGAAVADLRISII